MSALAWWVSIRDNCARNSQIAELRRELAASAQREKELSQKVEVLLDQKASLQEELEAERITSRLKQVEIDLLAAVCARNQIRVERENAGGTT